MTDEARAPFDPGRLDASLRPLLEQALRDGYGAPLTEALRAARPAAGRTPDIDIAFAWALHRDLPLRLEPAEVLADMTEARAALDAAAAAGGAADPQRADLLEGLSAEVDRLLALARVKTAELASLAEKPMSELSFRELSDRAYDAKDPETAARYFDAAAEAAPAAGKKPNWHLCHGASCWAEAGRWDKALPRLRAIAEGRLDAGEYDYGSALARAHVFLMRYAAETGDAAEFRAIWERSLIAYDAYRRAHPTAFAYPFGGKGDFGLLDAAVRLGDRVVARAFSAAIEARVSDHAALRAEAEPILERARRFLEP